MNRMGKLLDAWYSLLKDNISVPVYRVDVPASVASNFVLLRSETGYGNNTKQSTNEEVVVIVDVVTKFENNVNTRVGQAIDTEVYDLVLPTPQGNQLIPGSGLQVLNVKRDRFDYDESSDGVKTYSHIISRYSHRLHQQ